MGTRGYKKFGVGLAESEKRDHIKRAAREVFGRLGYKRATITDIIEKAGIARRTFYFYFEAKEDLLGELILDLTVKMKELRDAETPERIETREQLRWQIMRIAEKLIALVQENRDILKVLFEGLSQGDRFLAPRSEAVLQLFRDIVRGYIDATVRKGFIRKVDPEIVAALLTGMYLEVVRQLIVKGNPTPFDAWAREILALIEHGLSVPNRSE